jgi:hypothetical protein
VKKGVAAVLAMALIGCTSGRAGFRSVRAEVTPAPVVRYADPSPLSHGARVRMLAEELGDRWRYGVLSLEGMCVVWYRDASPDGAYIDFDRLDRVQISDVQVVPQGGWPLGIMGPVPGELWSDVGREELNAVKQRCRSVHEV